MTTKQITSIFEVLNHISRKERDYFDSLTEEQQKSFQPFVVMRWLTGTSNSHQVYFLNALVNPFVFSLQGHKKLLFFLLTIATTGKTQQYNWIKGPTKRPPTMPHVVGVIKRYFKYNTAQAIDVAQMLSNEDIIDCAEQLGYQQEEITKIKKELKNRLV